MTDTIFRKRRIAILWLAIVLTIAAFLFPPYGYTEYSLTTFYTGAAESFKHTYRVPWTYVTHRFLFAGPPPVEMALDSSVTLLNGSVVGSVDDSAIAWRVILIEIGTIALLSVGTLAIFGRPARAQDPDARSGPRPPTV